MLKKIGVWIGAFFAIVFAIATFGWTQRRKGRKEGAVEQKYKDEVKRIEDLPAEDLHDEITRPLD